MARDRRQFSQQVKHELARSLLAGNETPQQAAKRMQVGIGVILAWVGQYALDQPKRSDTGSPPATVYKPDPVTAFKLWAGEQWLKEHGKELLQ